MMNAELISTYLGISMMQAVLGFFLILIIIMVISEALKPRKSQSYRKLLTDMYVSGKIKQLAKKEDINLANEEKNFNLWCKKKRLDYLDLDRTIEEEMKEKIVNVEPKKSKE